MYLLTSLIALAGFILVAFFSLVKLTWELLQVSAYESPAILETPGNPATESYGSESLRLETFDEARNTFLVDRVNEHAVASGEGCPRIGSGPVDWRE